MKDTRIASLSDIDPVREILTHDETARLVDFFDGDALVGQICALLDDPDARAHMVEHYDLETRCLPAHMEWVKGVMGLDDPCR